MDKPLISLHNVSKTFQDASRSVPVLQGIHLHIHRGQTMAIEGTSGSGKTTLMHVLAGLEPPSSGQIFYDQQPMHEATPTQWARVRHRYVGMIYQRDHLLPEFTALDNVALPLLLHKVPVREAYERAQHGLEAVGLQDRCHHKPSALSGGERQRVAIARAVITQPCCLLADEPTGSLDHTTAAQVHDVLCALNRDHGVSLVVITHDPQWAQRMHTVLTLQQGVLGGKKRPAVNPSLEA